MCIRDRDWGVSRNRYWGTPLNIWECEECGHQEAIGSREQLKEMSGNEKALTVEPVSYTHLFSYVLIIRRFSGQRDLSIGIMRIPGI